MVDGLHEFPHTQNNYRKTLTALAILTVNAESNPSAYLDNFVPFLSHAIGASSSALSEAEISDAIDRQFRIRIPPGVVKSLLVRMMQRSLVSREDGLYALTDSADGLPSLRKESNATLRRHDEVIKKFISYAQEHGLELTPDDADQALFAFADEHGTAILGDEYGGNSSIIHDSPVAPTRPERDFVLAKFLKSALESDSNVANHLIDLIKGVMITSSLFQDSDRVDRPFHDTEIYFDTKVLLRAAGYAGEELQEATKPTLDLCKSAGGLLRCFSHNLEEAQSILLAASYGDSSARNINMEVNRYANMKKFGPLDLRRMADRLEEALESIGVEVVDTPDFTRELSVNEDELEKALRAKMPDLKVPALRRDLDSLTAVFRLRGGKLATNLENCRAILATTSSGLCSVARQYFESDAGQDVPIAIRDYSLQTAVWLKHPLQAPDLPRKVVIAQCHAAIQPSDALWRAYLLKITELENHSTTPEADLLWLRHSDAARDVLLDRTLNAPRAVTHELIDDMLAQRQKIIEAPFREKLEKQEYAIEDLRKQFFAAREEVSKYRSIAEEERAAREDAQKKLARKTRYERRSSSRRANNLPSAGSPAPKRVATKQANARDAEIVDHVVDTAQVEGIGADEVLADSGRVITRLMLARLVAGVALLPVVGAIFLFVASLILVTLPDGTPLKQYVPVDPKSQSGTIILVCALLVTAAGVFFGVNVWQVCKALFRKVAKAVERGLWG